MRACLKVCGWPITELSIGLGLSGGAQVLRLTRTQTVRAIGKRTRETVYTVTSLTVGGAGPDQIAPGCKGSCGAAISRVSARIGDLF